MQEDFHYTDGEVKRLERLLCLHDSRTIALDMTSRGAQINSGIDRDTVPHSPLNAIGFRMRGTVNTRLSELLKCSGVISIGGESNLKGRRALLLRLGAGFARAAGLRAWKNEDALDLWLSPEVSYLPVRMEFTLRRPTLEKKTGQGILRHVYELADFRMVHDGDRGDRLPFPHALSFSDPAGRTEWQILSVEINPLTSATAFLPEIPEGFVVVRDGKVAKRTLQGGAKGYESRIKSAAQSARELLDNDTAPRARSRVRLSWPKLCLIVGIVAGAIGLYLRRRTHEAR